MRTFGVYKGLQRPLVFKSFKGKFIYWGVGILLSGLLLGALTMALISMYLGVFVLAAIVAGGLFYTARKQNKGLHSKTVSSGIHIHQPSIKITKKYVKKKGL
ncbi:MAG: plasmid transfer protein [Pedobacter sp.]|nr:MAG: plasmid transfer protein [Pedobacter sp.]